MTYFLSLKTEQKKNNRTATKVTLRSTIPFKTKFKPSS